MLIIGKIYQYVPARQHYRLKILPIGKFIAKSDGILCMDTIKFTNVGKFSGPKTTEIQVGSTQ